MKLKKGFLFVVLMLLSFIVKSQEGLPIYTDYLTDNYYLIHPSMAGVANCSKIRLTTRQQWFGHEDAPKLTTLSLNGRIGNSQSAIGGILYTDSNGYHSQNGAYATYAHHLRFSRNDVDLNMLSFGISAGIIQYKLDETSFVFDGPDNIIDGIVQNETNFNIDLGFSYHFLDFYAHATVKNVLNNSGVNNNLKITSNLRRYLISAGKVFSKYGSEWSYEPSVLFQYREGTKESYVDLNGKVYKEMDFGKMWGGISYRRSLDNLEDTTISVESAHQLTPILGLNYNQFMFAYTYTHQLNTLVFASGGFHQFTLGYNFGCKPKAYRCNCPAVN